MFTKYITKSEITETTKPLVVIIQLLVLSLNMSLFQNIQKTPTHKNISANIFIILSLIFSP